MYTTFSYLLIFNTLHCEISIFSFIAMQYIIVSISMLQIFSALSPFKVIFKLLKLGFLMNRRTMMRNIPPDNENIYGILKITLHPIFLSYKY